MLESGTRAHPTEGKQEGIRLPGVVFPYVMSNSLGYLTSLVSSAIPSPVGKTVGTGQNTTTITTTTTTNNNYYTPLEC